MSVDAVEELAGWPDNENTFLVSGPDRLGVCQVWDGVRRFGRTGLASAPLARMPRHGLRRLDWRRGKILRRAVGRPARRPRPCRRRGPIGGDMADCHVRGKPIGDRKPWLV